jgi:hypothetical protein
VEHELCCLSDGGRRGARVLWAADSPAFFDVLT